MKRYIYERAEWPDLDYDERLLQKPLTELHHALGKLFGKLDALGFDVQEELQLSAVSEDVMTSSEIEGEFLNRSSVKSSVARKLGMEFAEMEEFPADHYTDGVVEMALDATLNYNAPLTSDRLFSWHSMLFPSGRSGLRKITVGAYRTDDMRIVSGAVGKERIHYVAPPPERVQYEMDRFLNWVEAKQDIDTYIKAGLSQCLFESIHPFDDGNGRIGRAIADLLLARAENNSKRYYSLSEQFLKERKLYYSELEAFQSYNGDAGRWLVWFLTSLTGAVNRSEEKIEASKQKAMLFDKWKSIAMSERQVTMINRLLGGFDGMLTAKKWAQLCKCSHDTALRDIDDLIAKGALKRGTAGGRSTSYELIL